MRIFQVLSNVFIAISFIFLISSIFGLVLNQPVLFSYAISESMEPTIGVGDLFLINPLSKGDAGSIIVFQMGDMYVVHRVYAIEGDAYITKGDNNIATDQQNGKNPPISTDKVVGEVVSFGGRPILVPGAGKLVEALHSNSLFLAALLISLGFLSLGKNKKTKKDRKRIKISAGLFYGIASSALILSLIASTMLSWGTLSFSYASTSAGGQNEGWYLPGSEFEKTLNFENRAYYPMIFFFEKDGELIGSSPAYLNPRDARDITLTVSVPEDTRIYSEGVEVYAYLPLLPVSVTESLYKTSPLLPLIVQVSALSAILIAVYRLTGFGEDFIVLKKRRLRI